jgi:hypothetical protein
MRYRNMSLGRCEWIKVLYRLPFHVLCGTVPDIRGNCVMVLCESQTSIMKITTKDTVKERERGRKDR